MAKEYKLSYTASQIDEKLGKVDDIDSLKELVGNTPVADQINVSMQNISQEINEIRNDVLELEAVLYDGSVVKFNILGQEVST